ncbi:FKBP-type peptidyl-prolyl cis-trans isomerase [Mitsuaria sp. WAJ17]|uniref:FKBP-type peptidyl-prolyl cis-trans isomerase n=1 Tax=Mitsuaria sp. WAJ17 TaxID=2761452 RepID=UPI0015FF512F|nr:FKBP-type peptidyl-prolyl cis-trans isomerase [Mitsuaria sp. WAJ17]MBB2487306.1 FKBP-type peptidyl-prolyl cis-trans isomerase [Mitsuaria sp. WAJ17]
MSFSSRTSLVLLALGLSCTAVGAAEPLTTATGLVYEELKAGSGEQPTAADKVRVHYVGTFADGREFDSSVRRGQPAEFPLGKVIKCWTEGVQRMKVGGKARLTCPAAIAYGDKGAGGGFIPPGATLHFEVELLGVSKP